MPLRSDGTWRNSWTVVGLIYFSSLVMWMAAAAIALLAIGSIMPFHFMGLVSMIVYFGFAIGIASGAAGIWRYARNMRRNEARLEADALHIRLFSGREKTEISMPWNEIESIHRSADSTGAVTVKAADGRDVSFTGYDFALPSRLARQIASRAGKEISAP